MNRSVAVIILNWKNAAETLRCLESVVPAVSTDDEVVVVDNGSQDQSVEQVRERYPQVTVIANERNLGYAEGNNTGIRYAMEQGFGFILVLNNDARIEAQTLPELIKAADANPQAAFLGPQIFHLDEPDKVQSRGVSLDYLWRSSHNGMDETGLMGRQEAFAVDCITGAAIFIRSACLQKIGLLDAEFFMYREDVDWCLRTRRMGYQIMLVPAARVWHRSHRVREDQLPRITYYMTRNSLLLIDKHHGGIVRRSLLMLRFLLTAFSWSVRPRWKNKKRERDALLQGLSDYRRGRVGLGYTDPSRV